jgi:hypothetical protein
MVALVAVVYLIALILCAATGSVGCLVAAAGFMVVVLACVVVSMAKLPVEETDEDVAEQLGAGFRGDQ